LTVGEWREQADRGFDELEMTFELEIFDNLRRQGARALGECRRTKAWMELFGDTRAAGNLASFEHDRFQTGPGEIAGGDQAIMAGADDDDVIGWHVFFGVRRLVAAF
jgi:hypothetical protein